ncbi:uncharacterized protein [Ptychodera flava]|uniref:uncharacterized protein n=1 Tax=Ptychodera flava TaxID=63121 RepID=UPI00396A1872
MLTAVEDEVLNSQNWKKTYDNISKDERIALQQLTNREDLTIKAADKGGGIVVMDTSWYIDKCKDHLQNQSFYKELDHDPTDLYICELENKVRKWEKNKWISRDIASKLIPKEPKPGHFYGLPKIHKENTPLRPIIPQCQALTSPLAAYVDHVLQPIVQSLPSYLKDTTHHLIDSHDIIVPDNSILVTMDVISLYTNIPHDYGIQAVREALADNNVSPSNQQLITEMLEFILTRNYFQFDGKYFLQVQGTAMGSKVAPSYANITMGKLEKQILANCPTKPMQWRRFIDDIRFIWLKTLQELLQFHEYCNSIHPSLKFTIEYSDTEISFLDTKMMMRENKIHTTVYSKPTDKHSYLLPSSCHPRHIFKSIPQGQALRYRRICSSTDLYNKEVENLHRHLTDRNYKQSSIVTAINKARNHSREKLINYTKNKHTDQPTRIPFVLTYHPSLPSISSIINKHWPILQSNQETKVTFDKPPVVAFRQPPNIKKMLVKARTKTSTQNDTEPVYSKADKIRKQLELHFIHKLGTLSPNGINKKDW